MKVLFVSSGNNREGMSPIVQRQGESLMRQGVEVSFFPIIGRGAKGYLRNLVKLKSAKKKIRPDIVHAHYSLSAYLATLAGAKPLIVSLMGSDVESSWISKNVTKAVNAFCWQEIIVKSEKMKERLNIASVAVIPNGVAMDVFYPMDKMECQQKLGWDEKKKHLLFAANPSRREKNYSLASRAFRLLNEESAEIHSLACVHSADVAIWMNAADTVLLTSLWEGSPNVIKEAMACNRPIVATDVGDIAWLFGDTEGCFLTSWDEYDVAEKIRSALKFERSGAETTGRRRMDALGLNSESVARRIVALYEQVLHKHVRIA